MKYPEFAEFYKSGRKTKDNEDSFDDEKRDPESKTPHEQIKNLYDQLKRKLADDLLEAVISSSSKFFERLVLDLLLAMGYGGDFQNSGEVTGQSGDEGIDAIIKQDKLGLDTIYIQAKRWKDTTIDRPIIQQFVGSLNGKRATKGVFITTSTFSKEAKKYVDEEIKTHEVVLIDGEQLVQLMIEHDVGVIVGKKYYIKEIDRNYFPSEDYS